MQFSGKDPLAKKRLSPKLLFIPIFLITAYLSLMGLDSAYFWDDEALVAIVAKNFVETGKLTGWDGRNLLTYRNGTLLDQDLRPILPPLECYAVALSFRIFGTSTWSGRFPFVLAGLLAFLLFAHLMNVEFRSGSTAYFIYTTLLLGLSTLFLLNIRQCRYYSFAMLFSLLSFWAYRKAIRLKRVIWYLILGLAGALLYYSNFLLCIPYLLSLGLVHLLFHFREIKNKEWWGPISALIVFLSLTLPYTIHYRAWERPDQLRSSLPLFVKWLMKPKMIWWFFREANLIGALPWIAGLALIYFLTRDYKKNQLSREARDWTVMGVAYVIFLGLLTIQTPAGDSLADIRFLTPLVPISAAILGSLLWQVHQITRIGAAVLLLILISTNTLTMAPFQQEFRWLLPAYLKEIHHPYPTAYQAASDFLSRNAKQDDRVMAFPDYANYPLMFYVGDKVKFCCLLDKRSPLAQRGILKNVQAPLFIDENFPEWIVLFGLSKVGVELVDFFKRPHLQDGKSVQFDYDLVQALDVYWEATQRPELNWHSFGPRKDFDPLHEGVYVFRRIRNP